MLVGKTGTLEVSLDGVSFKDMRRFYEFVFPFKWHAKDYILGGNGNCAQIETNLTGYIRMNSGTGNKLSLPARGLSDFQCHPLRILDGVIKMMIK